MALLADVARRAVAGQGGGVVSLARAAAEPEHSEQRCREGSGGDSGMASEWEEKQEDSLRHAESSLMPTLADRPVN